MLSRACYTLRNFPRLPPVSMFSRACQHFLFFRVWQRVDAFPRLTTVASLPVLVTTGSMFFRACYPMVAYFPALAICKHVFPRLSAVACFPASTTENIFLAKHSLHAFQRFTAVS